VYTCLLKFFITIRKECGDKSEFRETIGQFNQLKFMSSTWYLYLIRTAKGSLYTGITTDVERRFKQHVSGKGAKALKGKGPLKIEFSISVGDRSTALKLEYRVKQLSKANKETLIKQPKYIEQRFSELLKTA
jgi:putative endonuclease